MLVRVSVLSMCVKNSFTPSFKSEVTNFVEKKQQQRNRNVRAVQGIVPRLKDGKFSEVLFSKSVL
jgi:hypothetical protein